MKRLPPMLADVVETGARTQRNEILDHAGVYQFHVMRESANERKEYRDIFLSIVT